MTGSRERAHGYRWVVLFVFSLVTVAIEVQWLTFAPIAREARLFYGATALQIDLLSMCFMIIFLLMCIPASFVIDTRGVRIGVGTGALLTGVFSITKGVFAHDFALVLASQVGLAIAQPFIINASTKVAVQWFPVHERATAVGISTLSQFVGIIVAMVATPILIHAGPSGEYDLTGMLRIYGAACAVAALLLLAFLRERPAGEASMSDDRVPAGFFAGLKHILNLRDMQVVLVVFFVGLGAFNAISTCIDQIGEGKGFSMEQASLVGGLMLAAGIFGGLILPPLSDRLRKRKAFLVLAMAGVLTALAGLALSTSYPVVLVCAFVFGFFLLGAGGPIGFQYSAEICVPAPESSSQGLILLVGQVSGILFVLAMNTIGVSVVMGAFVLLGALNLYLCTRLNESRIVQTRENH
jgi:sugar phosphate permease